MTTTSSEGGAGKPRDEAVAPRVAVVIPCFRQAHFLGQAIESVLDQSRAADEVVVVDDGSPDNTSEVAANHPHVRCIRQDNAGLAGARNRGLSETTSEFIVFLDADDRLLRDALEIGVEALHSQEDCAFVWGFNRPIDAEGEPIGEISNPFAGEATYARLLARNVVGPPAGVMFRRGPVVELGGFSGALHSAEDQNLYLRLARKHRFFCHGRTVAEYRYHGAKMSSDHARMLRAVLEVLREEAAWVGDQRSLQAAIAAGRRHARLSYDVAPRIDALADSIRDGDWSGAIGMVPLLSRTPVLSLIETWRRLQARMRQSADSA